MKFGKFLMKYCNMTILYIMNYIIFYSNRVSLLYVFMKSLGDKPEKLMILWLKYQKIIIHIIYNRYIRKSYYFF